MAVSYKIKKYVNSKSEKNGQYYARSVITDQMDIDAVANKIQQNCSMKKSDVLAVINELTEVITEAIQDSKRVKINGFGSFKIGLHSTLSPTLNEFTPNNIKGFRVIFQPDYKVDASGKRSVRFLEGVKAQVYDPYKLGQNDTAAGKPIAI
jgi:predicted histone-like DNA-binding protein